MSLKEKILEDMKAAMKSKAAERLGAIRFLQAAVKNREIELRPNAITDQEIMGVIKKMAKQRRDSITEYEKANRPDLADKEKAELIIMEEYLPQQMSVEEITRLVDETLQALVATSIKQMGAVIREVAAKSEGRADNKTISDLVRSKLS